MQAYKTYKLGGKLSEMLYSPATYGVDFGGGGGRDKLPRPKVILARDTALIMTSVEENIMLVRAMIWNRNVV